MSNNIKRKDLFQRLGNIKKQEHWLKAAEKLGLRICLGSKHPSTVRDPKKTEDNGRGSLISVIPNDLHRIMNQSIFKEFLRFGIPEDELWDALDFE